MDNTVTLLDFKVKGKTISAKECIILTPIKEDGFLVYRLMPIGLDCYVDNVHHALSEIKRELGFLWYEYAKESEDNLDSEAIQVKRNLNALFTEN